MATIDKEILKILEQEQTSNTMIKCRIMFDSSKESYMADYRRLRDLFSKFACNKNADYANGNVNTILASAVPAFVCNSLNEDCPSLISISLM